MLIALFNELLFDCRQLTTDVGIIIDPLKAKYDESLAQLQANYLKAKEAHAKGIQLLVRQTSILELTV